jgi:hypothetical protein
MTNERASLPPQECEQGPPQAGADADGEAGGEHEAKGARGMAIGQTAQLAAE